MAGKGVATRTRRGGNGGPVAQIQAVRPERWTQEKQRAFLAELAATANVRASARAVGMSEPGVYKLRARSAEFRAAWNAALREGYAKLELMLLDRAMNGTVKPIFQGGKQVGAITEYSDRLALTLLAAHRSAVMGAGVADEEESEEAIRKRLEEKFSEMNRRMGGDG